MEASDVGIEQGRGTEQPSQKIPVTEPEAIKQPTSPLVPKISQVRAFAQTNLERLNMLLNGEEESPMPTEKESLDEFLARAEDLTPSEYLTRSANALGEAARVRQQITAENEALTNSVREQKNTGWQIDHRLNELDRLTGFKKIPAFLEKRRLIRQEDTIQQEIDVLLNRIQSKNNQLTTLQEQENTIKTKRMELLLPEITKTVQAVKSRYEQLFQEVWEDGTIPSEISSSYIQEVIEPHLEKLVKNDWLTAEDKNKFYQTLNAYLDHRDSQDVEKQPYKTALNDWLNKKNGFETVRYQCEVFLNGTDDRKMIQSLVAELAAEDIVKIKEVSEPHYSGWETGYRFSRAFEEAIEPERWRWNREESFGSQILSILEPRLKADELPPNMEVWQTIKNSPAANQVFEKVVRRIDQRYYQTALSKSLSDNEGHYIDLLRYYPTPDAIKNLVLLAAADSKSYRTVHANWSLSNLSERPDWKNILDEAETAYPSLKGARPLLESFLYGENGNHPDIKEAVSDFASDIIESGQGPTLLAMESLTNDSLLTILKKRGILPEDQVRLLKETDAFLKQIYKEEVRKRHEKGDYSDLNINDYHFTYGLRENLFALLSQGTKAANEETTSVTKRFEALSQAILHNKTNYPALHYLTTRSVIERIKTPFKADTLPVFLTAYQNCEALLTNDSLLGEFCRQFEGEQTVTFFRDVATAYQDHHKQTLRVIVDLVGKGLLSQQRALELPTNEKARDMLFNYWNFPRVYALPQLFLETDDGLDFLTQVDTNGLFTLPKELEISIGQRIRHLQREGKLHYPELIYIITPHQIKQIDELLSSDSIEVKEQNWQQLLMGYVRSQADILNLPKLSEISTDRVNTLFADPKVRDWCLSGLLNSFITYLKSATPDEPPFSLDLMSEYINYCGGAGPLSQIESLNALISSVKQAFTRDTTTYRTKLEICQGLAAMEDRFAKERWSNEDRTDVYNISRDILGAAPSLFSDYLTLFEKFTPSQIRSFAKDIYPLYRIKLVLLEKKDKQDRVTFATEELLHLRKDIRNFANIFNVGEGQFAVQKQKLLDELGGIFKDRFGIIKIPEEFTLEYVRSFTNISSYLTNLHGRTTENETVLGFYLSLMLNNAWDNFRRGETIDPGEYLTSEKSKVISKLLAERQKLNPLVPENLGISQDDMLEFYKLLQQETQNVVVGNIETIDVKLTNIMLNLQELEDLDLYPDLLDKKRMQLLLEWGNKKVGSVVARMYQSLVSPAKSIQFSEEDTKIKQQVANIIEELDLNLMPQTLKEHFQDGLRPLATVVNLLNFIKDTQAEEEIERLRDLLKPSEEVIEIFRRLGEDFKPTSGAMALSQDLSYLDNLIVKREDELTSEEKTLLTEYTERIRTQMVKLEGLYGQIKNKFGSLKQGGSVSPNPLLKDKLNQIDRIVNAQTTQQVITSTAIDNLNVIIENIRACLSCTKEGANNDTNLTFGDMNKFYLYSQSETQQKGSISDQLVFVEPVTFSNGAYEVAFVLDRIYGTNTPTILENQIEAVLKKYRAIKQRFPQIKLSVFVSDAAISSGGTSPDMLSEKLKSKKISAKQETVEVNVAESAFSDHYIEFGGNARTAGKRQVSGIVISFLSNS